MARKKKHEHVNHERWLVSYADFITLLFAFFVVMFAVSQVDSNKLGRFAESVSNAFQDSGIFVAARGNPVATGGGGGSALVPAVVGDRPSFLQYKAPSLKAEVLREALEPILQKAGLASQVDVRYDPRGVVLSLPEQLLFAAHSADFLPDAAARLRALAPAFDEAPGAIQVQTLVDEPYGGEGRGWELCALRAARVAELLADGAGVDPGRLSTASLTEPMRPVRPARGEPLAPGRVELVLVTEDPSAAS